MLLDNLKKKRKKNGGQWRARCQAYGFYLVCSLTARPDGGPITGLNGWSGETCYLTLVVVVRRVGGGGVDAT